MFFFFSVAIVFKLRTHDLKQRAASARHRARNNNLARFCIDREHFEIHDRHAFSTHATGHTDALGDAAARAATGATDRAGTTLRVLLAVRARAAVEAKGYGPGAPWFDTFTTMAAWWSNVWSAQRTRLQRED